MALGSQIETAAYNAKGPIGSNDEGWHLLAIASADEKTEAAERAGAIQMNRHLANRHSCTGLCDRPEHGLDVAAGAEVLEALGLIPYRYEPGQSEARWCGRCKQDKPGIEFDEDTVRIRSGAVVACCRSCAEARRVTRRAAKKREKTA